MEISVTHVKQKDLPVYVFPDSSRPSTDLSQKPPVSQPPAAAKAASASIAGVEAAAQEANTNLAEAMQEGSDKSGDLKRRRVEGGDSKDPGEALGPSPEKKRKGSSAQALHKAEDDLGGPVDHSMGNGRDVRFIRSLSPCFDSHRLARGQSNSVLYNRDASDMKVYLTFFQPLFASPSIDIHLS